MQHIHIDHVKRSENIEKDSSNSNLPCQKAEKHLYSHSIRKTNMISFSDELKHMQAYLSLEKICCNGNYKNTARRRINEYYSG